MVIVKILVYFYWLIIIIIGIIIIINYLYRTYTVSGIILIFLEKESAQAGREGRAEGEGERDFFFKIYLSIWGRGWCKGRERLSSKLPAEHRAQCGAWSHHPEIMIQAKTKNQMINWLNHPDTLEERES